VAPPTLEELQELCALWQQRLGLQDWQVALRLGRAADAGGDHAAGCCDHVLPQRVARITLREPADFGADPLVPVDLERTLVHELIHLHFAPFEVEDGTPGNIVQEQAINALTRALLRLAREGAPDAAQQEGTEPQLGAEAAPSPRPLRSGRDEGRA
jgi:hypothetical protein